MPGSCQLSKEGEEPLPGVLQAESQTLFNRTGKKMPKLCDNEEAFQTAKEEQERGHAADPGWMRAG